MTYTIATDLQTGKKVKVWDTAEQQAAHAHLATQPKKVNSIYDNGGKTLDRFTFVLNEPTRDKTCRLWTCLGTCATGRAFSQHSLAMKGRHLGRLVQWAELDPELQQHIKNRVEA